MKEKSRINDTKTRLETTPRSIMFSTLGGFKNKQNAIASAIDLEAALVKHLQTHNACIDLAYVNGVPRLVFTDKAKANIANNM